MTGEYKENKKGKKRKLIYIILLAIVILVPSGISLALAFQVTALREDVRTIKREISSWENTDTYMLADSDMEIDGTGVETAAENISADVDTLENQLVWENMEQNTEKRGNQSGIRKVYLTFDDGPSSNTDRILDILDEYGVKATFFVVGKEGYTEEYQRIVEEGHTLGMHSYSHKYREIYESLDAYRTDLEKLHSFLYEVTGEDCNIVRFPGGSSNTISKVDMKELIGYLAQEGITYFDWNVSSGDASSNYISASKIAENVLNNVWKYDSVVILMHDSAAKDTTVEALPMIIEKILESENTVLLPISEDTIPIQHVHGE